METSTSKDVKNIVADKVCGRNGECKYCGGSDVVKWGRQNGHQRLKCKKCGHVFDENGRLPKMRNETDIMASALYLYFDGLSLRKVQRYLKRRYGASVSFRTILGWIEKYVPTVEKFTDSLSPTLSGVWHSDETVLKFHHGTPCPVKTNGKKERRKGSQHWFWDCIDEGTRYLVSCHLSKTRSLEDGIQHFKNCKAVGGRPKVIITDKLLGHGRFIRKALWNPNKDKMVTHIPTGAIPRHGEEAHNQMIERFHGTLDDRVRPMRGLKSPATAIPRGFRIHYNFFKPHEGIDYITPAEAAGIHLPFNDGWGNLMTWATYFTTSNEN